MTQRHASTEQGVIPLGDVAQQINAHHEEATGHATKALDHARQAGELLRQVKNRLGHGEWLLWVAENVTVSPRQAQRYMKVADSWEAIQSKNDAASHLSIDRAIELTTDPWDRLHLAGEKFHDALDKLRMFGVEFDSRIDAAGDNVPALLALQSKAETMQREFRKAELRLKAAIGSVLEADPQETSTMFGKQEVSK